MIRERKVCNRVAQEQLNKQQYCIKKLLKEQEELKIDLNIVTAAVKAQQEDDNKKKLQALVGVVMDKTLKKEKDCQEQLDKEITTVTAETIKFKSVMTQCVERDRAHTNLQFLEKKLLRSMNYLDAQVNKIRELKTELKSHHDENARLQLRRTNFPHKNVTNDLGLYIRDNMKCTTLACENRINADNKITVMKKKEEEAYARNQRNIAELSALFPEETVEEEVQAEKVEEKPPDADEVDPDDEDDVSLEEVEEIEEPEEVTLDSLVTQFIKEETAMCELYTLINEQKLQITVINETSRQLQDEIHHLSKKGHSNEKGVFNFMGGLRNKSAKLQSEIEHYEIHEEMIERSLKDIKTVMRGIILRLGCVCTESPDDSLGDVIMAYLKMIEEKAVKLLNIQAYTKAEVNRLLQEGTK
ncbi:unnamed protein product [Tetraodon nigroviridis]|uniref:Chromosome 11 SCAF14979, whole genome shotgun sequence n=1 Tax=Tetraodon nigroviridis TaxID=99883 RepID=Q4RX47_TETNG|nr:unnamed protein product [Tetraodon nigroviridis]